MSYLEPNWSAPVHIKAFSTTRIGGISRDVYGSMNLGLHVGDKHQSVIDNRRRLKSDLELPSEPIWLNQLHSSKVVNADLSVQREADGSFSRRIDTVCAVMTADCLPLLLTNDAGDQVAAVHVGWRGLASGIVEKAISLFRCEPANIVAWAGPSIGPEKFEIGLEVREQLGGSALAYRLIENGKQLANLYLLCEQRLAALGVNNYSHAQTCTYSDEERFFSYRRDGQCGRMASLIWIDRTL